MKGNTTSSNSVSSRNNRTPKRKIYNSIELVRVDIKAEVIDYTSKVTVKQTFYNSTEEKIKARYLFPSSKNIKAVCGCSTTIDGNKVKGKVREFSDDSISGSGNELTYFLDSEPNPSAFELVIELESKKEVIIETIYVSELTPKGNKVFFSIPKKLLSKRKASNYLRVINATPTNTPNYVDENYTPSSSRSVFYTLSLNIKMHSTILSIKSKTNELELTKKSKTEYLVRIDEKRNTNKSIKIKIRSSAVHEPRAFLEKFPKSKRGTSKLEKKFRNKNVAVLSFFPDLSNHSVNSELVFVLDCSVSMAGSRMNQAKETLISALKKLPKTAYFQIVTFGSKYKMLCRNSIKASPKNIEKAILLVKRITANRGHTNLYEPLNQIYSLRHRKNYSRSIFLISDGEITTEKAQLLSLARQNCTTTRIFTFGIGNRISHQLLDGLALASKGASEYIEELSNTEKTLEKKLLKYLARALQPSLTNVRMAWENSRRILQAPLRERLPPIWHGERYLVYVFLPKSFHKDYVTLVGDCPDGEMTFSLQITRKMSIEGDCLHTLAAHHLLSEIEESSKVGESPFSNLTETKKQIVALGTSFGLSSSFTNYVPEIDDLPAKRAPLEKKLSYPSVDIISSPKLSFKSVPSKGKESNRKSSSLRNSFRIPFRKSENRKVKNTFVPSLPKIDKLNEDTEIKMIVLGAAQSGKSTLLRSCEIVCDGDLAKEEREELIPVIRAQPYLLLKRIIKEMKKQGISLDEGSVEYVEEIVKTDVERDVLLSKRHVDVIYKLWSDAGILKAYENIQDKISPHTKYFIESSERFSNEEYLTDDFLRVYKKTRDIEEFSTVNKLSSLRTSIVTVGGARDQRRKWAGCFEDCSGLFFTVNIAAYDQKTEGNTNCMQEALRLWRQIVNLPCFEDSVIVLLFTHFDEYRGKIKRVPLNKCVCFTDFDATQRDISVTVDYIKDQFLRHTTRPVVVHMCCSTDTDSVKRSFDSTLSKILEKRFF